MRICDFCSTAKILMDFIGESKNINQIDFMYELIQGFHRKRRRPETFDFDNGLVCRWLNGTAKLSSRQYTAYYSARLAILRQWRLTLRKIYCPLLYDKDMAADGTVSSADERYYTVSANEEARACQTAIHSTDDTLSYQDFISPRPAFCHGTGNS